MKRKEIRQTVNAIGELTCTTDGSMQLVHRKTKETIEVDMALVLAIARGTLDWVDSLFDKRAGGEPKQQMQGLLASIGYAIACDLEDADTGGQCPPALM